MKPLPSTLLDRALAHYRQGRLRDAAALCDKVLRQNANAADALHLLGRIRAVENRNDEAAPLFAQAVAAKPQVPPYYADLGLAQLALGDHAAAARSFAAQIDLEASNAQAHYNLGRALYAGDDRPAALASFRRAVQIDGQLTPAHYNIGVICQELHRDSEAEAAYRAALACDPRYFDALSNLVVVLRRQGGKLQDALQTGLLAVHAVADDADNWNNLGLVARDLGDLESAEACIDKALSIDDRKPEYFLNMGSVLLDARQVEAAMPYFRKAIELAPDYADAHFSLGLALLLSGDYPQGWREYEWRLRVPDNRHHYPDSDRPQWHGEPPGGKRMLIVAEQGLGDTLQFVRYAAVLAERGAAVTVVCQPPLLRLLTNSFAAIRFVGRAGDAPPSDCWAPMMSLPRWLDDAPGVPPTGAYLRAAPVDRRRFAELLGARGKPRVGLVWSGDPRPGDVKASLVDRRRSMHFSQMAALIELPGIAFFSVQKGQPAAQLSEVDAAGAVVDLTGRLGDFADTAALLENLDLLITVDTSMAHLAGGLGVPVWMLSRFDGCWRWLREGASTPWYPTMSIYRQSAPGDWTGVIARVKADLESFAESRSARQGSAW